MADHDRIWLEPECCAEPGVGRVWCQVNEWMCCPAGECDKPKPTEYVRADLVAALVEAAGEQMREACVKACDWHADTLAVNGISVASVSVARTCASILVTLPLPTPSLDAIRAQARREGMDVAAKIAETDRWARTQKQIATAIRAAMGDGE